MPWSYPILMWLAVAISITVLALYGVDWDPRAKALGVLGVLALITIALVATVSTYKRVKEDKDD